MKKNIKKILSVLMSAALLAGSLAFAPVKAQAEIYAPESETLTYYNTGDYVQFGVSEIPAGTDFDVASVKSSDTSVATVKEVYSAATGQDYGTGHASIYLTVKKAGKTTVSYKIGKETYKTKITFKKGKSSNVNYKNPLASITVSGLNGDKDFASKFDKSSGLYDSLKLSKTQSKAAIKVKAKSGWNVESIDLSTYFKDGSHYIDKYDYGKSSATLDGLSLKKSKDISYSISISFSGKDGQYAYIYFNFN